MQKKFEEYAKLLVEVGVNVQKGQNLVISCPVDCAWFARMCAFTIFLLPICKNRQYVIFFIPAIDCMTKFMYNERNQRRCQRCKTH